MIGRLRGTLVGIEGPLALVDCGGVGYEVVLPETVAASLPREDAEVTLLIRQIVREDGSTLYGFIESFQRRLFDLLLTVSGCGPKAALALLGQLGADAVAGAIMGGDVRSLTRATGVGARTAERIVVDLKDKMPEEALARRIESATSPVRRKTAPTDELVDALLALGYRRSEAESAAETARERATDESGQLREALKVLQKK